MIYILPVLNAPSFKIQSMNNGNNLNDSGKINCIVWWNYYIYWIKNYRIYILIFINKFIYLIKLLFCLLYYYY